MMKKYIDGIAKEEAGSLEEGDDIIAFDEYANEKTKERYVRLAKITHAHIEKSNTIGIKLENL